MHANRTLILTLLFAVATGLPAAAQYGPGVLPNQPGGVDNNPAPAGQKLAVPDYIKPGFQMIYMTSSYSKTDSGASTGMGFTVYTMLAVLEDKVLVSAANYLTPNGLELNADGSFDYDADSKAQFTSSANLLIRKSDITSGEALWMPVEQLNQLESTDKLEVGHRLKPYQGETIKAVSIAIDDTQFASVNTFHAENGMKLEILTNLDSGKQINQMQLLGTKQIESPLLGAKWPDWAKSVKKMSYKGTYTMAIDGAPLPALQLTSEVVFKERGDGYAIGKTSMATDGKPSGSSHAMEGPGSTLGHWVHPDVLANLDPGTVEENKIMRTKTTYQVQQGNLGRLGVFVHTNATNTFYAVNGYNLQTGALTYVSMHTVESGVTVELVLDGIESE